MTNAANNFVMPPIKEECVENDPALTRQQPPAASSTIAIPHQLDVQKSFSCPLPKEYDNLYLMFVNFEKVVSVAYNRSSRITFDIVARNIAKNTKRTFTPDHLSQIIGVFPDSYTLRWEKRKARAAAVSAGYELVLRPQLNRLDAPKNITPVKSVSPTKTNVSVVPAGGLISPTKRNKNDRDFYRRRSPTKAAPAHPAPRIALADTAPRMDARCLTARKMLFRHFLALRVLEAHREFLRREKLELPPNAPPLHPDFDLERACGALPRAPLPKQPAASTQLRSAYDYFRAIPQPAARATRAETPERRASRASPAEARTLDGDLLKTPPKLVKLSIADGTLRSPTGATRPAESAGARTPADASRRPVSLLERLRASDAAKKSTDTARIVELERRCARLERLDKSMVEVICGHYNHGKVPRHSMSLRQLMPLVMLACEKLDKENFREHIDELCKAAPDLCRTESLDSKGVEVFLKISEVRVDKIRHRVEDALERARRELRAIKK